MATLVKQLFSASAKNLNRLAAPILLLMVLSMMVLPLPTWVLDFFFTFNIAISIVILFVAIYTVKPLDFSSFPTVLLMTTLLRLSLNVASTRIILLKGNEGSDAAGKVIEAFGHFLIGGNFAVGLVVFIILVIINFVVITKGAGRIAEVSARFTLDAMPGKQMAIDADLNAGLIGEDEARTRRAVISQEADFFGSMDGASKFVRGDAIAGIIIMIINVIGGLIVGISQHDMTAGDAANVYVLLTIGDGLVAQIPGLLISVAAGLVVSRVATDEDTTEQLVGQLFKKPVVLYLTAAILGLMGIIPGMPNGPFLFFAALLGGAAFYMDKGPEWAKRRALAAKAKMSGAPPPAAGTTPPAATAQASGEAASGASVAASTEVTEATWSDVTQVDMLGLEVGYRLIPLVDKGQDGELLRRIKGIRKKFAQEIGFLSPPVHIRDNLELKPNMYRLFLKGVDIGGGEAFPGMTLAINPGRVSAPLAGTPTTDPAFGLPAIWIDSGRREQAQSLGYTVVDAATVVATHLNHLMLTHAAELLGRQETQSLLDHIEKESPKLIEDLTPALLPLSTIQKVLQNLLDESVHIRDMRTILETLLDFGSKTQDPTDLTAQVRVSLGRAIIQQVSPGNDAVDVMVLDPALERIFQQAVNSSPGSASLLGLEPGLADRVLQQTAEATELSEEQGHAPILLVSANIRVLLSKFLRRSIPQLNVISHNEMPDNRSIKVDFVIGTQG